MQVTASIPNFSAEDIDYILSNFKNILNGNGYLSTGMFTEEFEKNFASYIGTEYAIACNSGTSALEIIFRAIDISGFEVILPSNTFVATANAIINAGGIPVFADIDEYMCLDYEDTISRVNSKTKAICHVHIGGLVTKNAIKLAEFCTEKSINFVEDSAQAHGSAYIDRAAGNLGIASGFSFYSTKVMTTAEGGMITTNDKSIYLAAKSLREFGKTPNDVYTNIYQFFGYNWRMPEVASLMGIRQLASLDANIKKRKAIAEKYDELIDTSLARSLYVPEKMKQNYYKYVLKLNSSINREKLHRELKKLGVQPSGYIYEFPLHKMQVFSEFNNISLPKTEDFCARHFCLPIHPRLNKNEVQYVADSFNKVISTSGN
jgi:perosamine synthetase